MQRVKTGIIGLGYWGPNVFRNFAAQEHCDLAVACDLSEQNVAKLRQHYPSVLYTTNADDLFSDASLELILIATPTHSHYPLAKKALESGKHVFIEKPMTETVEQASELNALAEQNGKLIFVDHTFVFASAVQTLAEMARGGNLGKLLYFDSTRINLGLIQKDTNVLYDLAIHDLSILNTFMDLDDVRQIDAYGSKHFGTQEEDVHLHMKFASGFQAHIHVSWLSPVKLRRTILAGDKAMITYDDIEPSEKIRVYDSGIERDETKPDPFFPKYRSGNILIPALANAEPLAVEAAHVLKCVRGLESPRVSGKEGEKILRTLARADQCLKSSPAVS